MSTFCTVKDVRTALTPNGTETPNNGTGAELPDWQIEDAILEAEGTITAYLAERYQIVPVEFEETVEGTTTVYFVAPSPIRGWTRNIAAYLIALTYRRNKDLGEDDPIRLRFNMTMGHLRDVRDRKMNLPLPGQSEDNDQGVHVENLYQGKLFGMDDVGLAYDGSYMQRFEPLRPDVW